MGGRGFACSIQEDTSKPGDMVINRNGLRLIVDQGSLQHLRSARIDYEEELQGGGLVVRNPNAIGDCHCGRHDIFEGPVKGESGEC